MQKSIVSLLGLVAVLSACGAPTMMAAPTSVGSMAATPGMDPTVERLFDSLKTHFQIAAPSLMSMGPRAYGPAWGFVTIANKPTDKALTEVNVGSITNGGKITTMISFASRLDRTRNPQLDEATTAIKSYITGRMGTTIDKFVISTNPTGHDKFAYLAIGKHANDADKLTWFHAGTYAVGSKQINSTSNFGTSLVK
jgi:hypothetical protein